MFLSKLVLNPRNREARRDLSNPYELHRTLSRAFAPDAESTPARFLWRLESTGGWQQPIVLVQSATQGNWTPLNTLSGYLQGDVQDKAFEPDPWLVPGGTLRFRLLANPTVTREGKRWGLHNEEDQLGWLMRQGKRHGFTPTQALVSASSMQQGRKAQHMLSVLGVTFDGYLQVQDPVALLSALQNGVGPAKSLGCGLLTVARA